MRLSTQCEIVFEIGIPTPFIFMLRPRSGAQQWVIADAYRLEPMIEAEEFTDVYGNLRQRLVAPPGRFAVRTRSEVLTAEAMDRDEGAAFVPVQELPNDVLDFLLPSRYCESDRFNELACAITRDCDPGIDAVAGIERWLRDRIPFRPGSSDVPLSAAEVYRRGYGVCRDLAHLGIALCRSLCFPARLVAGYLYALAPMDLHAWFEVYVGGRWYSFDATQPRLRGGYVPLGYGHDASDVAVYTQYGPPVFPVEQRVTVERLDEP